ncbi:MAG: hypothetical protein N3F05_02940 [Candidatus Diapherotrites archaeon]|nr:hypothetical protein [Candidatus Diapherotrites archaeon]
MNKILLIAVIAIVVIALIVVLLTQTGPTPTPEGSTTILDEGKTISDFQETLIKEDSEMEIGDVV